VKKARTIQWKALLMLVVFAANFTVFCHCAAAAQKHSCCCEKKSKPCNSGQSIQFNLVEKQLADQIQAAPLPVIELLIEQPLSEPTKTPTPSTPDTVKHPPPDLLILQQRLLI
jgi:hypothetical protein